MKKRKKMEAKVLSNRQKVKEQAKALNKKEQELQKLYHENEGYNIRINYLRASILDNQKVMNEQNGQIEALKAEVRELEIKVMTKRPFWKRVIG